MAASGITIVSPDALLLRLMTSGTLVIVFWRGVLSAVVLFSWLASSQGKDVFASFKSIGWIGMLTAVLSMITAILFVAAINHTTVASVLVIVGAQPICAAVLSTLILKEPISRSTLIAGLAVCAGLGVVFHGAWEHGSLLGDLMAFGAMLCVALRYVLFRSVKNVDMLPSVVVGGTLTAVILFPMVNPFSVSARDLVLLVIMGAVLMPLAQMLLTAAPRYIAVPEIALIVLLEAVLAPTWVWLVLGEVPPHETLLGGGIIIGTLAVHFTLLGRSQLSPKPAT
jgi:drug/metabolite transporter (DMT)-like permease